MSSLKQGKNVALNEYLKVTGGKTSNCRIVGEVSIHGERTISDMTQSEAVWGTLDLNMKTGKAILDFTVNDHPSRPVKTRYIIELAAQAR